MKKIKWLFFIGIAFFWAAGVVVSASPRLLKPGDKIYVNVAGESELSGEKTVGSDGSISLPLIGSVGVAGMKTTDAAQLIKQMLEDGFLNRPVVTVEVKNAEVKTKAKIQTKAQKKAKTAQKAAPKADVSDELLYSDIGNAGLPYQSAPALGSNLESQPQPFFPEALPAPEKVEEPEQILVEVKDSVSGKPVAEAILSMGNKVYQSNRLGQILLTEPSGRAVLIADGYETVSDDFNKIIIAGSPAGIMMNKRGYQENITFTVVDVMNGKPIKGAEIILEGGKITTNKSGEFKIGMIKKEFGELTVKKRGYKDLHKIVDYKGPDKQTLYLMK